MVLVVIHRIKEQSDIESIGDRILDLELQWNCKTGQIVQSGASVSVIANQFKFVKIKLKSLIFMRNNI
jgi:hypothetical protein